MTSAEWGKYSVGAACSSATTGASSATVAIPNDSSGTTARYVRIVATGLAWVRPVQTGGSVTAANGLLITTNDVVLNVRGFTHIAHIQQGSAQTVNICPLEV